MLQNNNKVSIVACSNGLNEEFKHKLCLLESTLEDIGLHTVISDYIFAKHSVFNASAKDRANSLMKFYLDNDIKAIFDISGGDAANAVITYLDYDIIKNNPKPFFGYSDLTTIINGIYAKTSNKGYLYQVKNLIGSNSLKQIDDFTDTIINKGTDLLRFNYEFIQGSSMKGVVIGGNIRCFLKLAGTEYMPSFKGKILMLESLGGDAASMYSLLNQLKQLGAFKQIAGIILGTFTNMESKGIKPTIEELLLEVIEDTTLPVIKTNEIGHGSDSKCIIIGKEYEF